jgi:hypothetical protein
MDFFAMSNEVVEKGEYWSLVGVGHGDDLEAIRRIARTWLETGDATKDSSRVAALPALDP